MNSPVRATADIKADSAQPAPLILSHTEAALGDMRRDVVLLEPRGDEPPPLDIASARMRALAKRIIDARHDTSKLAARDDAALETSDTEIVPVSRAAIAGLRAFRAVAAGDDEIAPSPLVVGRALANPSQSDDDAEPASRDTIGPQLPPTGTEVGDDQPPVPLRRANTQLQPVAAPPPPTDAEFEPADGSRLPALLTPAERSQSLEPGEVPAATHGPDAEEVPADIRLVDLIRRQKTLLDQLSSYQGMAIPAEAVQSSELSPPAAPSVIEQLAPQPSQMVAAQVTQPTELRDASDEATSRETTDTDVAAPPARTPAVTPRLRVPLADNDPELPDRSPMIIERALAERSRRHGANENYKLPSPLPAFAAGITIALAIAGTLFYLL